MMPAMATDSEVISVADAAKLLKVSTRQVRNLIDTGVIAAQLVGGSYIIRRADLAKVPKDRKPGPKGNGKPGKRK